MKRGNIILHAARARWVGGLVSFSLRHFSGALPIKKVYEDAEVVGFHHPAPSYQPHLLIVPKVRARTPFLLSETQFRAVLRAAGAVARGCDFPLQLRVNGGCRQEVAQAHFHLYPASTTRGMRRTSGYAEALSLVRNAAGFSIVVLMNDMSGIWVDGTEG